MSLFGGLYVGASGLKTSQNSLNTVAHNLSNLNTVGYVRQQVAQADVRYRTISTSQAIADTRLGDGVQYSECRHIRDYFLDQLYREESGRYSFYETSYSAILEVEDILGELDGDAFAQSLDGLWTAFQELSKTPSDGTYISLLVSKAASFAENANAVYESMKEYQGNLNLQIKEMVDDMNSIAERIDELNLEIATIEVGGLENANDLRDERDLLLDTLSKYGNITYSEDLGGRVSVRFNNVDFVTDAGAYKIGMLQDNETGFYTPYWEQNVVWRVDAQGERYADYSSANLFNLTEIISTENDTDIGGLRALLLARGNHVANYTDIHPDLMTDIKLESLGITFNQYNEEYGTQYYNDHIANSVIMNVQAEFDNLVHYVITTVNEVLAEHCEPENGYLCNPDGTPMQLFLKSTGDSYEKVTYTEQQAADAKAAGEKLYRIYDKDGNATNEYWKYIEEDENRTETLYNSANVLINQELVQTPAKLGFVREDDSTDFNIGKAFIQAFDAKQLYLNPNATAESTFQSCYIDLVGQVGTSGDVFNGLYEFQQLATQQVDANRQTVIGTSADEELEHMIMYQNAYNAASRYINVINTLLDSVINMGY